MQRDYFRIDRNANGNNINERESPINSFRGEDEVNRRRAGIPVHEAAERAIRERYLDEQNRLGPPQPPGPARPPQSDFASPLPPPPHPHHYGVRWTGVPRGVDPPSSLMSPESPEDCRPVRHPPSPHLLKMSDPKSEPPLPMQHYQLSQEASLRSPHSDLPQAGYPSYIPPHYRPGPMYSHPRLHDYHPYSIPSHHHHHQHHGHLVGSRITSGSRSHPTTPPRSNSHPDLDHRLDEDPRRTSPIVNNNMMYPGQSLSTSPGSSSSLKHRILVRPPDLDLSSLERERYLHLQRVTQLHHQQQQLQQQQQTWKVPESPRMSSRITPPICSSENKNDGQRLALRLPPSSTMTSQTPQYPAHFALGSLIQLSNGDLKRVEELTTEDFVQSAKFSLEVGIDQSAVTHLKQSPDNGSVTIGFSVGKQKIQVAVEAAVEHPFFIMEKGWSSASPQHTMLRYRLPCHQLKVGDVCISLTHRSQNASVDSKLPQASKVAGDMRPPPVPPADRERHCSRSSSPALSNRTAARLSPLKQVVFSDRVVLHSPPSSDVTLKTADVENGSKIKLESRSDETLSNFQTASSSEISKRHLDKESSESVKEEVGLRDTRDEKGTIEDVKARKIKRLAQQQQLQQQQQKQKQKHKQELEESVVQTPRGTNSKTDVASRKLGDT